MWRFLQPQTTVLLNITAVDDGDPSDPRYAMTVFAYRHVQVNTILTAVVRELDAAERRRFVWSETSFWMRWYEVQSDATKALVHKLVDAGRLEFVGGGWVQNDEAGPSYESIINQITEGHEYLLSLFGKKPRVAWQIDPFGHSAAFAAIAAGAGYDALVINRIEDNIKKALKGRAAMEFVWQPYTALSAQLGEAGPLGGAEPASGAGHSAVPSYANTSIFTHVLHTHYSAPKGYDFENPEAQTVFALNVAHRAASLISEARHRAASYRTRHLLVPWGDDFKFQRANHQFTQMDMIVDYVTQSQGLDRAVTGVALKYSTLNTYFDAVFKDVIAPKAATATEAAHAAASAAVAAEQATIPIPVLAADALIDGGIDFFPYADNDNSWWVGYFTSRPSLKQAIRHTQAALHAADALVAALRPWAAAWQTAADGLLSHVAPAGAADAAAPAGADGAASAVSVMDGVLAGVAPYTAYSWLAAFQRVEQARLDSALCLHHDAITGTSRQHVVDDYADRMREGARAALGVIADIASLALGGLPHAFSATPAADGRVVLQGVRRGTVPTLEPAPLTYVPHVLPIAQRVTLAVDGGGRVGGAARIHPVVLHNPTAWHRVGVTSVMVDLGSAAAADGALAGNPCARGAWPYAVVTDASGEVISSQWYALVEERGAASAAYSEAVTSGKEVAGGRANAAGGSAAWQRRTVHTAARKTWQTLPSWQVSGTRYELAFRVSVPPLGLSTYFVSIGWRASDAAAPAGASDAPLECGATGARAAELEVLGARPIATTVLVPGLRTVPTVSAGDGAEQAASGNARQARARLLLADARTDGIKAVGDPDAAAQGKQQEPQAIELENACLRVEVDPLTGLLTAVTYKHATGASSVQGGRASGVRVQVRQSFATYSTSQSGAYIFRPVNWPGDAEQFSATPIDKPHEKVTVSVVTPPAAGESRSGAARRRGALLQAVRVVGPRYSHTLQLPDTLGWYAGTVDDNDAGLAAKCADPLLADAGIELRPTVAVDGNKELVMIFDTDLVAAPDGGLRSPRLRDNIDVDRIAAEEFGTAKAERDAAVARSDSDKDGAGVRLGAAACPKPPHGWWTSDGLGLIRRQPAPANLPPTQVQRHYYPFNTATRVSGRATALADGAAEAAMADVPADAWLTLYTSSPFGVGARLLNTDVPQIASPPLSSGTRIEIMLHRHLLQDDGRGLSTGVYDGTVLTPRLQLSLAAHVSRCRSANANAHDAPALDSAARTGPAPPVHEDWVWTWASRAAAHVHPLLQLHADLDDLAQHLASPSAASSGQGERGAARGDASGTATAGGETTAADDPAARTAEHSIVPPLDPALNFGTLTRMAASEDAVPREAWTSRFSAGFTPLAAGAVEWRRPALVCGKDAAAEVADLWRVMCHATGSAPADEAAAHALPPWVHLLTLQARDAVSDDIVLRLQNVGGPATRIDVRGLVARATAGAARAVSGTVALPLKLTSLRPRTLSLNRHEPYLHRDGTPHEGIGGAGDARHRHRQVMPTQLVPSIGEAAAQFPGASAGVLSLMRNYASVFEKHMKGFTKAAGPAVAALAAAVRSAETAAIEGAANQNTNEAGVFISDAALKGMQQPQQQQQQQRQDGEAQSGQRPGQQQLGRLLLERASAAGVPSAALAAGDAGSTVTVHPATIRAFFITAESEEGMDRSMVPPPGGPPSPVVSGGREEDAKQQLRQQSNAGQGPGEAGSLGQGGDQQVLDAVDVVAAAEQRRKLVGMIKEVPLAAADRERMLASLATGDGLSADDKRLLALAERKANRQHKQDPPEDLSQRLDTVLQRKQQPALPPDPWADAGAANVAGADPAAGGKGRAQAFEEQLMRRAAAAEAAAVAPNKDRVARAAAREPGADSAAAPFTSGEKPGAAAEIATTDEEFVVELDAESTGHSVSALLIAPLYLAAATLWMVALLLAAYCLFRRRRARAAHGRAPSAPNGTSGGLSSRPGGGAEHELPLHLRSASASAGLFATVRELILGVPGPGSKGFVGKAH